MPDVKVLELFSGTHSIGKVAHRKGYKVYSLDRDLGAKCPLGGDYESTKHFQEDIMNWDYKQYPVGFFDIVTASPVCLWWSVLRNTWIGRKCKSIHATETITAEILDADIDIHGKPMVDKVFEIIEYFKPKYWWIENPQTGKMRYYIEEKYPSYNTFYDVDYCKYSDWGYKKRTRFWTNIKGFIPKKCKMDCENIIKEDDGKKHHNVVLANGYEMIDGKKVLMNTKALRDKYKGEGKEKRTKHHKKTFGSRIKTQSCVGGGSSRLERYRIPEKLILDFFQKINIL